MAVESTVSHCGWTQIYKKGQAPAGAKTLDVTITAGGLARSRWPTPQAAILS